MCRVVVFIFAISITTIFACSVKEEFIKHGVDKVLSIEAPDELITVIYPEVNVKPGMKLKTLQATPTRPDVYVTIEKDQYYTFLFLDPDALSRKEPIESQIIHWLIVNISLNKRSAQVLETYMNPEPPSKSGEHRYTFLLYQQPGKVDFSKNADILVRTTRMKFNVTRFAEKYDLGQPVAGNFFLYEILSETDGLTGGKELI